MENKKNKIIFKKEEIKKFSAVTLETFKGLELEVYDSLLLAEQDQSIEVGAENEKTASFFAKIIKSWNIFKEENQEEMLEITPENVKVVFNMHQVEELLNIFVERKNESKKS